MKAAVPMLMPVFRSQLTGDLLALILPQPEKRWTIHELAERTGTPYQTTTAEVRRLEQGGLLSSEVIGRTKLLSGNTENPYYRPLTEIVVGAFGPPAVIVEEASTVSGVEELHLYGSWAARHAGEAGATPNDVDVLVVGRPDRDELHEALRRAEQRLDREVNATIRSSEQWKTSSDSFTKTLRKAPILQIWPLRAA